MATTATTAPSVQTTRGWLVNSKVDVGFVLVGGVLISAVLFLTWRQQAGFLVATTLFAILSDFPHVLATSARIWLDPTERAAHGSHWVKSFVLIGVAVVTVALTGAVIVALVAWTYWQILHVLKQHYGVISIYAAKHRYAGEKKLTKRLLILGCLSPVLFRASHGFHFAEYVMFDFRLPFSGLTVPTPPVPGWAIVAAYAGFAVFAAAWLREQRALRRSGAQAMPAICVATLGTAIVSYNVGYLLVSDLYALILIATAVHSLQYHVISWSRNHGRFYGDDDRLSPEERRLLLARLSSPRALPWYALILAAGGAIMASAEQVLLGALPLTFVFHHFYMDGVVWKSKRNPGLGRDLRIAPPKAVAR